MIDIRKYNEAADYDILKSLWSEHKGWVAPLPTQLPTNGLVATYNGEIIGCNFLFSTDSSISIMEFLMFSQSYRKEDRSVIIDELINQIVFIARYNGFKSVMTWTDKRALKSRYNRLGFVSGDGGDNEGDGYLTNMIKQL